MRVLFLTGDGRAPLSGLLRIAQEHRGRLRKELGVEADACGPISLSGLHRAVAERRPDVVVAAVAWDDDPGVVETSFRAVRESAPATRVVFFDWYDSTSTPHFGVLPWVDLYAKAQVLRDLSWHGADLKGGYVFTDFLSQSGDIDLTGWAGSVPDRAHAHKVVVAWNIGVGRTYRRLVRLGRALGRPWALRTIDVHARVGLGEGQTPWYGEYRRGAVGRLAPLGEEFRVLRDGFVPRWRYWAELLRSRIVVSPFGWGEVCFRDFEAVCCGCLLVKPSMSHLRTSPDIFVEHETYVPVRWDLSDLEGQCRAYLARPHEARRLAREAQRRLAGYFAGGGVVSDLRRILERLKAPAPPAAWGNAGPIPWRVSAPRAARCTEGRRG